MVCLNYKKIKENFPNAFSKLNTKSQSVNVLTKKFDEHGVRVYLGYGASGGHKVTVYRKQTKEEYYKTNPNGSDDCNWQMIRIGIIQSQDTRLKAYKLGFEEAFNQLEFLIEKEK